eukprot:m.22320 g.22320  ORF g.22320 m.22320 type:complete len:63 (+) comp5448_c0_seq1:185-373(+)
MNVKSIKVNKNVNNHYARWLVEATKARVNGMLWGGGGRKKKREKYSNNQHYYCLQHNIPTIA